MNSQNLALLPYAAYKDSGVEWLGQVPEHWTIKRLKDIGTSIIGITYSPEDVVDDDSQGVLVLRSSNIQNGKLSLLDVVYVNQAISYRQTVQIGDILICSRNGSRNLIGKNICIDESISGCTFGAFMTVYRSRYFKFISNFFNSQIFKAQSGLFMSSTINQLTINTLNNFLIYLPSLPEQTAIANYLDQKTAQIDQEISLLSKKAELYASLKQSLINETVTRGLDKNVRLKDSGVEWLGQVPEHWEVKRIVDLSAQNKTRNSDLQEQNLLSLSYGKIIRKNINSNIGLLPESFENYQITSNGTIILRLTDLQNDQKSLRVGLARERGIITSAYLGLNFKNKMNHIFTYYLLTTYDLCKVFYWFGGGLRSTMRFDDIKVIPFVIPPLSEQTAIADYLDQKTAQIDTAINTIKRKIDYLQELRKTLINDVVTGKICPPSPQPSPTGRGSFIAKTDFSKLM